MGHEGGDARDLDELGRLRAVLTQGAGTELGDREGGSFSVDANTFGGGHLHRLCLDHFLALNVTGRNRANAADEDDDQAEAGDGTPHVASLRHGLVTALTGGTYHPPDGQASHEGTGHQPGGRDDVRVLGQVNARGNEFKETAGTVELGATGVRVEAGAHGVLHPCVGCENPGS